MRRIKLMADYQCHPLWEASPGVFGDISPASLPISDPLREDLNRWATKFDTTLDLADQTKIGFDSQADADKFISEGYELLRQLKDELGPHYEVSSIIRATPRASSK